jgi:hypothetical protein
MRHPVFFTVYLVLKAACVAFLLSLAIGCVRKSHFGLAAVDMALAAYFSYTTFAILRKAQADRTDK